MKKGTLFLIPNLIAEIHPDKIFSSLWREEIASLRYFVVEDLRSARQFLSSLKIYENISTLSFQKLDRETSVQEIPELLRPLLEGFDVGVLSESGSPGVADPGALAVQWAHDHEVQVRPLVGPSSILLALMASGLNGQRFSFHGYLPIQDKELSTAVKRLERESREGNVTQIFIESPHRNAKLLATLKRQLLPETRLCVACDLTGAQEKVVSLPVRKWPVWDLPKMPCIFLFLA